MDQLRVQLHKFETKDQCEKGGQLRDRQLNLARMQLNWYLKSKLLLRTSLNKSQIEDWVGCWHVFGTISFKWNGDVSSTVSKKKYPKGVVLNDIVGLLLPLDTRSRGRRRFPSPAFLFPLSLKQLKKMPTKPTHLLATWWKNRGDVPLGRLHSGRPGHPTPEPRLDRGSRAISSPVFLPINTRERESRRGSKRKEQNRRGKELKTKRKKKRITEEEKKKKQRSRWEKKKDRHLEPPPFRHQHHRQRQQPLQVSFPLLFNLLLLLLRFLLHCSRCMWTVEWPTAVGPAQMVGPGPDQLKKNLFLKNCNFSVYFSTKFCLILVCIFIP